MKETAAIVAKRYNTPPQTKPIKAVESPAKIPNRIDCFKSFCFQVSANNNKDKIIKKIAADSFSGIPATVLGINDEKVTKRAVAIRPAILALVFPYLSKSRLTKKNIAIAARTDIMTGKTAAEYSTVASFLKNKTALCVHAIIYERSLSSAEVS